MAIIKCEYCGTPYDPTREICPLCGIPEDELELSAPVAASKEPPKPKELPIATKSRERRQPNPQPQTRQKEKPEKKEGGMPKTLVVLIALVLGLTVLIGTGFLLLKLGVFDISGPPKADGENLELPLTETGEPEETPDVPADEVIACTALDLAYQEVDLYTVGEVVTLKAKVEPANTTDKITWESSDEAVCTVDQDGRITAVGGGTATVTATCGKYSSTSRVTCSGEAATTPPMEEDNDTEEEETQSFQASLNLTDITLFEEGEFAQLKVSGVPDGINLDWSVANPAVAELKAGLVSAVSAGTTKVTVTAGDQKLECIVRCNFKTGLDPDAAETVVTGNETLSTNDVTLTVGEQFILSLENSVAEATWTVGNTGVCTISSGGTVTATGSGTTEISTTIGDNTLTCIVRVN